MGEINYDCGSIEEVLKKMEMASRSFDTNVTRGAVPNHGLDVLREVEEINHLLEKLMEKYKYLLIKNEAMVRHSLETMRKTDESLSSTINIISEGRK